MGSWGVKALESDCGLGVIDFINDTYQDKYDLVLSEILAQLLDEGLMSATEIDYLYDSSVISLAELVVMYDEHKKLAFDHEDATIALENKKSFTFDKESLEFIYQQLLDIQAKKPDAGGMREYVELWLESSSSEKWQTHINVLLNKIEKLKKAL